MPKRFPKMLRAEVSYVATTQRHLSPVDVWREVYRHLVGLGRAAQAGQIAPDPHFARTIGPFLAEAVDAAVQLTERPDRAFQRTLQRWVHHARTARAPRPFGKAPAAEAGGDNDATRRGRQPWRPGIDPPHAVEDEALVWQVIRTLRWRGADYWPSARDAPLLARLVHLRAALRGCAVADVDRDDLAALPKLLPLYRLLRLDADVIGDIPPGVRRLVVDLLGGPPPLPLPRRRAGVARTASGTPSLAAACAQRQGRRHRSDHPE